MPNLINESSLRFAVLPSRVPPARLTATFIARAAFRLIPDSEAVLLPEDDQPMLNGDSSWDDDAARGLRFASDFAPFKPGTDLLLAGHCHAPGGRPVEYTQVSFAVEQFRKSAVVIGDRWIGGGGLVASVGRPTPFTRMPLEWSRAWGGADVPENPIGRGRTEVDRPDGMRGRLAGNIESVEQATSGTGAQGKPFGFGPIDPAWRSRMRKVGTYDASWLANRWPWYPDDFDWTYFSAAPPDQYLHGTFLRGDESMEFVNLHAEHAVLRSRLPGLFARSFVSERRGDVLEFREVPLRIDTLFADLDAGHVALTWRGVTPAPSLKLPEFEDYFVVLEPLGAPFGRELADYVALYRKRRAEIEAEFEVLPVVLDPLVLRELTPSDSAWADRLQALADAIHAEAKQLTDPAPPPTGYTGKPLPAFPVPPPPKIESIADANALIKKDFAALDAHNPGTSALHPPPDFSDFEAVDAELAALQKSPDDPTLEDEKIWTRELVAEHVAAGGHLVGQELEGLDLSDMELSGIDFSKALLNDTNLARSRMRRSNFKGAEMVAALLIEADFEEACLAGADLTEVSAERASFSRADLAEAEFSTARIEGACFKGATGAGASFTGAHLAGADFNGANLPGADFSNADLNRAQFLDATLTSADMDGADATGASFAKASAVNLRASGTILHGASFRACRADDSVFEESILTETDFREARLNRATLTGSQLDRAVFGLADLRHAKLDDVRARDATFVGVNLFRATLERADLARARFLDCNLFEVELWDAILERSQVKDSNIKRTRLER